MILQVKLGLQWLASTGLAKVMLQKMPITTSMNIASFIPERSKLIYVLRLWNIRTWIEWMVIMYQSSCNY